MEAGVDGVPREVEGSRVDGLKGEAGCSETFRKGG